MLTAKQVADYFLSLASEESGDLISNLKLQKLLYYAQGFHLALFGEPLFGDSIEAWQHGPVVPTVYHHFKDYGSNPIRLPQNLGFSKYSKEKMEFLNEVYEVIGQFSAWKLRNMTHEEPPWKEAFPNGIISRDSMKRHFDELVEAQTDEETN